MNPLSVIIKPLIHGVEATLTVPQWITKKPRLVNCQRRESLCAFCCLLLRYISNMQEILTGVFPLRPLHYPLVQYHDRISSIGFQSIHLEKGFLDPK